MVSYRTFSICMYFFREIAITRLQRGIYRGRLPVAERRPLLISRKKTQSANWLKIIHTGCCHPVKCLLCLSTWNSAERFLIKEPDNKRTTRANGLIFYTHQSLFL